MTKQKLTPWYLASTSPVRIGCYECKRCGKCHYWNGRAWQHAKDDPERVPMQDDDMWRGIAK